MDCTILLIHPPQKSPLSALYDFHIEKEFVYIRSLVDTAKIYALTGIDFLEKL